MSSMSYFCTLKQILFGALSIFLLGMTIIFYFDITLLAIANPKIPTIRYKNILDIVHSIRVTIA